MAKPTRAECKDLISRLKGLPFPPTDPAAFSVLIDVLVNSCESLEHARAVVDKLAKGTGSDQRFPTGYDIRQAASDSRTMELRRDPECPKCDDAGFVAIVRNGYTYSGKCDCWRPAPKEFV